MARVLGTRKVVTAKDAVKPSVTTRVIAPAERDSQPGAQIEWKTFRKLLQEDLEPSQRTAGKHFACLAPTRGGKTTLVTKGIIPLYVQAGVPVLVIDSTSDPKLADYGERMPRFGKMTGLHRVSVENLGRESITKTYEAIMRAYKQGDMLIYVDEVRHVCDPSFMGLKKTMETIWLFGGKRGITLGGATQAPRWVPSSFYDQSQCHFLFRIRDVNSRKRIEEISGDTKTLRAIIPDLPQYNFAYVSPDGDVSVSKYKMRGGGGT